jgi:hypothetical protein
MGKRENAAIWCKISLVAHRQYGHITRIQLFALGAERVAITSWIRAGRLIRVHAGVYAVGVRRHDWPARAAAAVLACGDGAALSHGSAASLWGLTARWSEPLEVTAPRERRRPGIVTHRAATLGPRDTRVHLGIQVTSPARALLDIAPRTAIRGLTRALNDARHEGRIHTASLNDLLDRNPRHPGTPRLLSIFDPARNPTRSGLEDDFLAFAARYGLPTPIVNAPLNGVIVDVLFPEQRLIVELDGWEFHSDRQTFEADRERDAAALATGHATVRITWARLEADPAGEAARLGRILSDRSRPS